MSMADEQIDFLNKQRGFLGRLQKIAKNKITSLKFDKKDDRDFYAMCAYGTMFEMVESFIKLFDGGHHIALGIIVRSIMEVHIDLIINFKTKTSHKNHFATYLFNQKKFAKNIRDGRNNYFFKEFRDEINTKKMIRDIDSSLEELAKNGFEPLSVHQRFKIADMQDEYNSLYEFLSWDVHNNLAAMERRHIEKENGDFHIVWHKGEEGRVLISWMEMVIKHFGESTNLVHINLGNKNDKELRQLAEYHSTKLIKEMPDLQ